MCLAPLSACTIGVKLCHWKIRHLKRKHKLIVETIPKSNDPERFKCSYCGKIFTQGRGLKDHINTHTGMY